MIVEHIKDINSIDHYLKRFNSASVKKRRYLNNQKNELYCYRDKTIERYVILSGLLFVKGSFYGKGTILTYEPLEQRNFFVIREAECIVINENCGAMDDEQKESPISLQRFIEPYVFEKDTDNYESGIKNDDITVVIQGAVDPIFTPLAIESVRLFLPGASIVLSTWEGMNINSDIKVDDIVFNVDPGAPRFTKINGKMHIDNRNRLLVSTQGGIRNVSTRYTLKMRSDCILCGNGIVRNYGRYSKKVGKYNIFKEKLVIGEQCNILQLHFKSLSRPYLFHISDWFVFGLTEDVKCLFERTEIESDAQIIDWKYKKDWPIPDDDLMGLSASPRYNSEQYYFLSALKRKYDILYEDASDYSDEARIQSELSIVDNFEILNLMDHEIINAKKQNKQAWNLEEAINAEYLTSKKYQVLYEKYTNTN